MKARTRSFNHANETFNLRNVLIGGGNVETDAKSKESISQMLKSTIGEKPFNNESMRVIYINNMADCVKKA
jgi:hypothetical protein